MKPIEQRIIDLFYEETGKMTLDEMAQGNLRKGQFPEKLAGLLDKWLMEGPRIPAISGGDRKWPGVTDEHLTGDVKPGELPE